MINKRKINILILKKNKVASLNETTRLYGGNDSDPNVTNGDKVSLVLKNCRPVLNSEKACISGDC